jgi:hypothetical protein
MQRLTAPWAVRFALATVLAVPGTAIAQDLEAVIEWNRLLQVTVAGTPTPTVFFTRPYAMVSIAVFDAVNSIDRRYRPYVGEVTAPANASRAAAAAQAAHDVLLALYPNQRLMLDLGLALTLNGIPRDAARAGVEVGAAAAQATLDARARDRWNALPTEYLLPNLPGYYQVTPPQNGVVTFTHYPDVQPFVIGDRLRFLVAPPPGLTSEHYAADFNEVKSLGSATGSTRTAEQTSIAQRWAGVSTSTQNQMIWNNVVRDLVRRAAWSAVDAARAYALLNMALHDALLVSFNGKFVYGLWRPVTAIRNADADGNPATAADPNWLPLLATPPYPSYPGNMSCIAAVSARTLERVFGRDDVPFAVTWTGAGGAADITRSFNGFRHLADEQEASRIYGGIHFRFDHYASFGVCTELADYGVTNYLRAR